jgi:hypothetical protein
MVIYLENIRYSIELNRILIESVFIIQQIINLLLNPLYAATENGTQELLRCPDSRINENQIAPPLICNSQFPFYALVGDLRVCNFSKIWSKSDWLRTPYLPSVW